MLVDMWMTPDPLTIDAATSVSKAAMLMVRHEVRRLPVVDRGRLVGIVSAGDVARAFPADLNPTSPAVSDDSVPRPVSAIMSRDLRTVPSGTAIEAAARVMRDHKIGAMPVMRGTDLVGILTESDVFRAFVEMNDVAAGRVRVTFDLAEDEDVTDTIGELCRAHGARVASIMSFHHRDRRTGDRKRLGVVRLQGGEAALLDALWGSHHRVLSVMHE
jgi:acetoin utilization protein AcuB